MKKIVYMLAALLMVGSIAAADVELSSSTNAIAKDEEPMILQRIQTILIDNGVRVCIAYDVETGVMYILSRSGGICQMVDEHNNPRIYIPTAQ